MFRQVFLFVYDEDVIIQCHHLNLFKGTIANYKSTKQYNPRCTIPITMNAFILH